jgi:hypothetical protein
MHVAVDRVVTAKVDVDPHLPRFLEQPCFSLEELRVDDAALEIVVGKNAAEE